MEGYTYYFPYEETLPHRKREFWKMPCSMGVDLSRGDDFCSFTFLFPLGNGAFGVKTRAYISSLTQMKLPSAMRVKYDSFMKEGSLVVLEGTVLDMMDVYDDLDSFLTASESGALGSTPTTPRTLLPGGRAKTAPSALRR